MPYGAVPDDVEIQKLTRAQQNALSRHNIHENINTFLGNETTPLLMGGIALLTVLPILIKLFWDAFEAEIGPILTPEQKMKVEVGFRGLLIASPATGPIVIGKKVWDVLTGEGDVGSVGGRQP